MNQQTVEDVNLIASFLASPQIDSFDALIQTADCIVLCGSSILHCAETVFRSLYKDSQLAKTLVICGGYGHSTQYLYDAIAKHRVYGRMHFPEKLPEGEILWLIYEKYFDAHRIREEGCAVLIEDGSTNCGENASETRMLLESQNITVENMIIVQDPTMSLRTLASFQKAYDSTDTPEFVTFPTFTPRVKLREGRLVYDIDIEGLWSMDRFLDLIMGEIPRLLDNETGYGPQGRNFIAHVDVPSDVLSAWTRLKNVLKTKRQLEVEKDSVKEVQSSVPEENITEVVEIEDDRENDEEDVYVIEKIVRHRRKNKQYLYLVRWENYGPEDDTWEPHDELMESANEAVDAYWTTLGGFQPMVTPKGTPKGTPKKRPADVAEERATKRRSTHSMTPSDFTRESKAVEPVHIAKAVKSVDREPIQAKIASPVMQIEDTWQAPHHLDSWESLAKILGLVKYKDSKLVALEWLDEPKQSLHEVTVLYEKMPQSMLRFYEKSIVFMD